MVVAFTACKDEPPQRSAPPRQVQLPDFVPPTAPAPDSPWWCTKAGDQFASCYRLVQKCDERRLEAQREGHNAEPCTPAPAAVCFEARAILDGKEMKRCFDSITICRNISKSMIGGFAADYEVTANCEIRR